MATRGRRPKISDDGERIVKTSIKIYPSRWRRLAELAGGESSRAEIVRRAIEHEIWRLEQRLATPSQ